MNKIIAASGAVALAATLTACISPGASSSPTVTVTQEAPAPVPVEPEPVVPDTPSVSDDEMFLTLVRSQDSWFDDVTDSTLTELGRSICGALDKGMTLDMYADIARSNDIPDSQSTTLLAAAIVVYCPEHESIAG